MSSPRISIYKYGVRGDFYMFAGPNVQYDRKIRYLDYYENGQRCQGAGFIKLERRNDLCNISLQVNGLYRKDRFTRPFLLVGEEGEQELCKLQIAEGGIKTYFEGLNSQDLGGQGISYDQLLGIKIPIADGKEIRCFWRRNPSAMPMENSIVAQENKESNGGAGEKTVGETIQEPGADPMQQTHPIQQTHSKEQQGRSQEKTGQPRTAIFQETKWDQLWMIYPHVHPFSDDREFLSVSPSDFVVLNRQSYPLVNNSFLLHGYYSFRHLILMRGGNRGQAKYYIGVPGNLYERDRKSAIMFGFESFECAKEPAKEGDFGYYLIPVEL